MQDFATWKGCITGEETLERGVLRGRMIDHCLGFDQLCVMRATVRQGMSGRYSHSLLILKADFERSVPLEFSTFP
jgi:hypothetical protein